MIVTDIEGTTSSIAHVHDVLFPYSRARISSWVRRPEAAAVVREVAADPDEAASVLVGWIDADVKATPLKTLQGLIWAEGYASGELTAHVYDDVPPVLARWSADGVPVYVYSSGSELAQRLWFRHTQHGDLLGHFAGHFDTVTAGPKREVASYEAIAGKIGVAPGELTFLSDVAAELDAAQAAGWHTVGVSRPEDGSPDTGAHRTITSFAELDI
ncbi:acireductone synthase [Kutzneria sp. NPDC051319]|uniref:acireductone synthase n=1 Tax=Kutzneria sp. NPDC051319 TaxID=3155047 RepID=UPI003448FFE5